MLGAPSEVWSSPLERSSLRGALKRGLRGHVIEMRIFSFSFLRIEMGLSKKPVGRFFAPLTEVMEEGK